MIRYTRIVMFLLAVILLVGCGGKRAKVQTPATVGPRPEATATQSAPAAVPQAAPAPMTEHERHMQELRQRYGVQTQPGTMAAPVQPAPVETSVAVQPTVPQAEEQHVETTQPSPLATKTVTTDGTEKTVWSIVIPHRPDDRKVLLDLDRMRYGLQLIEEGNAEAKLEFIDKAEHIQPGPNAWEQFEKLVIAYAGQKVLTDRIGDTQLGPENFKIATTPEEIRQWFNLDPTGPAFHRMDWQRDPVGKCLITKRSDFNQNLEVIDSHWRKIYSFNPQLGELVVQRSRACIAQQGDSERCYDAYMKDIRYLQRNYGANSVGENESYDKGTNRPDAKATVFYVEGVGFLGLGQQCCGNPLSFFTYYDFSATTVRAIKPPEKPGQVSCQLQTADGRPVDVNHPFEALPDETVVLRGRAVGDIGNLQLTSEWRLNDEVQVTTSNFSGSEEFPFGPKVTQFKKGHYTGLFRIVDQFGRASDCPFRATVKTPPPPPPPVISKLPPVPIEPPKIDKPRRRWWPYVLAGAAAAGAVIALTHGGSPSKPVGTPGVPGYPGGIPTNPLGR